jgi:hypothetical protein
MPTMAERNRAHIFAAALLAGCGGAPASVTPPASSALPAPASAPLASATPPVDVPPAASASASAVAPTPPAPDKPVDRLVLEPAYSPGAYPWPAGAVDRKARMAELEVWNAGGVASGERWHAAPRVVIGEPQLASGKASPRDVMRALRHDQYWTVRRCYEPKLRDQPKLEGRTVLELVVASDGTVKSARVPKKGRVRDDRKHGHAMSDRDVVGCLARGFTGIRVPAPRTRTATMQVSIDVWPGDAPLPEPAGPPGAGKIDLAKVDEAIAAARGTITPCFEVAPRGAWGRTALRVEVGDDGHVDDVDEVETRFADADAIACVSRSLRALTLPSPSGGSAKVIVALRWAKAAELRDHLPCEHGHSGVTGHGASAFFCAVNAYAENARAAAAARRA